MNVRMPEKQPLQINKEDTTMLQPKSREMAKKETSIRSAIGCDRKQNVICEASLK